MICNKKNKIFTLITDLLQGNMYVNSDLALQFENEERRNVLPVSGPGFHPGNSVLSYNKTTGVFREMVTKCYLFSTKTKREWRML